MMLLDPVRMPLLLAAISIAMFHTLVGVDHYLPFVVLGRARRWSTRKVLAVTAACGLGHVIGSLMLGFVGIAVGIGLGQMEWIESTRGAVAAWLLIGFGIAYMAWSWVRIQRDARHAHVHIHEDGMAHTHEHNHHTEHVHVHSAGNTTFWGLFVIFILGPCEPLIPLLMVPAFEHDWWLVVEVSTLFAVVTIGTMMTMAYLGTLGLRMVSVRSVEKYSNVMAGGAITMSGMAIQLLGI
jgi:ABC-type nickel/cobalt efflux system permease component RcnA